MHIDPKFTPPVQPASTANVSHLNGRGSRRPNSGNESSDDVQLSHLSSVLNGLAAGAAAGAQHIASFSALFKSGAYQVNSVQVSQRIIDDALSAN